MALGVGVVLARFVDYSAGAIPLQLATLGATGWAMMIGLGGTLALAGNGADPRPGK